jgi:hypothetical protein
MLRIPPAEPMLRMLPALPMLRMLPALPILRMLPALSRHPIERKLSRLQRLKPLTGFETGPRLYIARKMIGRFLLGALAFLAIGYSAWFITWYSGVQSGHGSPLPPPPYSSVLVEQAK